MVFLNHANLRNLRNGFIILVSQHLRLPHRCHALPSLIYLVYYKSNTVAHVTLQGILKNFYFKRGNVNS